MDRGAASGSRVITIAALVLTSLMAAAIVKTDARALAVLPALIAGGLILWRPELGLLFMAFLLPFEDALLVGGTSTITKFAGLFVAGAWIVQKTVRRGSWQRLVTSAPLGLVALLLGLAALSVLWAQWPQLVLPRVVRLAMLVAFCLLALDLTSNWSQLHRLVRALVVGGTIAAVMVILQYSTGLFRRAGESVSGDVNSTAMMLVVLVPFAFSLIRMRGGRFWRLLGCAYVGLTVIAVSQTLSRMSYMMLVLVLALELWVALHTRRSRLVSVLLVAIVVGIGFRFVPLDVVQDRAQTIIPYIESTLSPDASGTGALSGRGYHLKVASVVFKDHLFLGVGYSNLSHYFLQYQFEVPGAGGTVYLNPRSAHSAYMALLADLGLIGAALWVPFLSLVCIRLYRSSRSLKSRSDQSTYLMVRALATSFGIFLAYGFYAEFQLQKLFWLLAGLALAVEVLTRSTSGGSQGAAPTSTASEMSIGSTSVVPGSRVGRAIGSGASAQPVLRLHD